MKKPSAVRPLCLVQSLVITGALRVDHRPRYDFSGLHHFCRAVAATFQTVPRARQVRVYRVGPRETMFSNELF